MVWLAPKLIWRVIKRPAVFTKIQESRVLQADAIFDKIKEKYNTYPAIMGKECILSVDYVEPSTIKYIYSLIESGRADTIKEALNIYENNIKMNEMSNSFQSQLNKINRDLANLEARTNDAEFLANSAFWSSRR